MKIKTLYTVIAGFFLSCSHNPASNSAATMPTLGLVAYYQLDSSAVDASGKGNDGTIYGATPTTDRFGRNGAYYFNGAAYIDCGNDTSLQITPSITLAAWIKPQALTGGEQKIIHKANSIYQGYELFILNDALTGRVGGSGTTMMTVTASAVVTLNWQFVALTYDSAHVKLYWNGTEVCDSACTYQLQNAPYDLTIGKRADRGTSGALYFNGAIDDIRIYNRALSSNEIAALSTESH